MATRSWELVATDESTVVAEPFLDAIVVEDRKGSGRFANTRCTDESDRFEVFGETDHHFNEFVASETSPGSWRRNFSRRDTIKM